MQAGLLFNLLSYITDTHLPLNNHSWTLGCLLQNLLLSPISQHRIDVTTLMSLSHS